MDAKIFLKELSKKKWIVQGFNSSLNYIMHGPLSSIEITWKYLGYGYTETVFVFDKDYLDYYYLEKDFVNVGTMFLKHWQQDHSYFDIVKAMYDELVEKEEKVKEEIFVTDLGNISDEELVKIFKRCAISYTEPIGVAHLIEGLSYVVEPTLKSKLSRFLGIDHHDKKFREIFTALMQPSRSSWVGEEYLDLLNIASLVTDPEHISDDVMAKLKEHRDRFYFNQLNYYHADGLTAEDYVQEIKNMLSESADIGKKIEAEKKRYEENNRKRKEIIDKYDLPDEIISIVNLVVEVLHWQDDRKKDMLSMIFYLDKILKEISVRFDIPHNILKMCSWKEMTVTNLRDFDLDEGKRRLEKFAVYFWNDDGVKGKLNEIFFTGEDYHDFMKYFITEKCSQEHLHGMSASSGVAMGKVRICRTRDDISSFEKGDVLVAMMTRPEFVPAMKKASAIVTEEGGITSHAAIVSRELGRACVIGVKNATKVLKDGDIVEVNANHGLVKRIE